jgi:hypothetical protein
LGPASIALELNDSWNRIIMEEISHNINLYKSTHHHLKFVVASVCYIYNLMCTY